MKRILLLAASVLSVAMGQPVRASSPLSEYRWKNRLLLWQSHDEDFRRTFRMLWSRALEGAIERDLLVEEISSTELRTDLSIEPGETAVVLVGKDGGVKRVWREPVGPNEVFAIIDAMPMRKDEMSRAR